MKDGKAWWRSLNEKEKSNYLKKIDDKKASTIKYFDLDWARAEIIYFNRVGVLVPWSRIINRLLTEIGISFKKVGKLKMDHKNNN